MIAPVAFFCYNRLETTAQALAALKVDILAAYTDLHIFSDGPKKGEEFLVAQIREFVKHVTGFKSVHVHQAGSNKGCAASIIDGVTELFDTYEKVIVVEDDLIAGSNFLSYMNAGLACYVDENVWSIAGWSLDLKFDPRDRSDIYYSPRGESWGWATWRNRWQRVDWEVKDYPLSRAARRAFAAGGQDLPRLLDLQMAGKIDSWAIRWCYAQCKSGMLTVHPKISKAINIGFNGTHVKYDPQYPVTLDTSGRTNFIFGKAVRVEPEVSKQYLKHYGFFNRLKNYIRRLRA